MASFILFLTSLYKRGDNNMQHMLGFNAYCMQTNLPFSLPRVAVRVDLRKTGAFVSMKITFFSWFVQQPKSMNCQIEGLVF